MEDRIMQTRAFESKAVTIATYKLSAKPLLISEGEFKGELLRVTFTANCANGTLRWIALNCGQFDGAFTKMIPHEWAAEIVEALTGGKETEFPGLYRLEQFSGGFRSKWSHVHSALPCSSLSADRTETMIRS